MELSVDVFIDDEDFDYGNHAMNIGSMLVPHYYNKTFTNADDFVKGFDTLMIELGSAGSNSWMDFISK